MDLRSLFGTTRIAFYSSYKVVLLRSRTSLSIQLVPLQAAFVSNVYKQIDGQLPKEHSNDPYKQPYKQRDNQLYEQPFGTLQNDIRSSFMDSLASSPICSLIGT
eukprot:1083567-Alexandrium_andersonii.AAC.1